MLEYSGFLAGQLYYETFRTYFDELVEEAHFYADGRPIYLREHRYESGWIRSTASAAVFGADVEEYTYVENNVVRIAAHHAKRVSGSLPHLTSHADIEAAYDSGELLRLTSTSGRFVETLYERRRPTSTSRLPALQSVRNWWPRCRRLFGNSASKRPRTASR